MLFGLSYLRIGIYAVWLAVIGGLLWREHYLVRQRAELQVANRNLTGTIETERAARAKEQANADEKSGKYQGDLRGIDAAPDLGPVRLCHEFPPMPATKPARTASRSDAAPAGHVEEPHAPDPEAGRDIGPELSDFVEDCEANAAQLQRLQEWVTDR